MLVDNTTNSDITDITVVSIMQQRKRVKCIFLHLIEIIFITGAKIKLARKAFNLSNLVQLKFIVRLSSHSLKSNHSRT